MDLDVSVDKNGKPYLGHTEEYYKISGEIQPICMPFNQAITVVVKAHILVIIDCKHHNAWPTIEKVVSKIGDYRCLIHSFVNELKFAHNLSLELDYPVEWSPISKLTSLKNRFPDVTVAASCKFLPNDLLTSEEHKGLLQKIRNILFENKIDTLCLNIPDNIISNSVLEFFLANGIISHIGIDHVNTSNLTKIYIGETDNLNSASNCRLLGYS